LARSGTGRSKATDGTTSVVTAARLLEAIDQLAVAFDDLGPRLNDFRKNVGPGPAYSGKRFARVALKNFQNRAADCVQKGNIAVSGIIATVFKEFERLFEGNHIAVPPITL
jgi:hypothetical protein